MTQERKLGESWELFTPKKMEISALRSLPSQYGDEADEGLVVMSPTQE